MGTVAHHIGSVILWSILGLMIVAPRLHAQGDTLGAPRPSRDNLGPNVNSISIEILPLVSPDGKTLYFDRKYDSANVGGEDDEDDIYYSMLQDDGSWSPAVNMGPPFNSPGSDVLFWIAPDGATALIHSGKMTRITKKVQKKVKGKMKWVEETAERKVGLAIVRKQNGVWGEPIPLQIEGLDDLGIGYYAFFSTDTRKLLLAYGSDPTNEENLDIYYCSALANDLIHWSEPVTLGPTINTPYFEGAPFMATDNRTLYFASVGHDGEGGSDIFMSRRIGDSWDGWSEPVNLGPFVNTPLFEASLSIPAGGNHIYMSGSGYFEDEVSYGRSDLFRLKLPDAARPDPVALISGTLFGGSSPVQGLIRVRRSSDNREIFSTASDADGRFTLVVPLNGDYKIISWAVGYNENVISLRASDAVQNDLRITLDREGTAPIEGNLLRTAPVIHFAIGSDALSGHARKQLRNYLPSLRGAAGRIDVIGHTDAVGDEGSNQELSLRRAERVSAWLTEQGVDRARIVALGRGEAEPVASNDTTQGRGANRRVEIVIASK